MEFKITDCTKEQFLSSLRMIEKNVRTFQPAIYMKGMSAEKNLVSPL